LAFGATTAALVTLASGGTALLVAHGTTTVSSPTSIPGGLLTDTGSQAGDVIVDRAPGTLAPRIDATEQALREALAQRGPTGRRILTVPLVHLGGATGIDLPGVPSVPGVTPPAVKPPVVVPPVVNPPVVTPPVVTPPVVTPPVVTPPVVTPPVVPPVHDPHVPPPVPDPTVPADEDGSDDHKDDNGHPYHGKDKHHNDDHDSDGKDKRHTSSRAEDKRQGVIDLRDHESDKRKHARSGRHAR
jgi:hypothetical protein